MTTAWSAVAGTSTLYEKHDPVCGETRFDAGETHWDIDPGGNVPRTRFDAVPAATTWSTAADAATDWSPA